MRALDAEIREGCVRRMKSFFSLGRPAVVDGFAVHIFPKGMNLYKTFLGFPSEKLINEFTAQNPDRPSWFGNKYLAYFLACADWGSIVSFKLVEDLVLIDWFNKRNLKRLLTELAKARGRVADVGPLAFAIRQNTGLGLTEAQQVQKIAELYPGRDRIWYYPADAPIRLAQNTYHKCPPYRRVAGLNPLGVMKKVHFADIVLCEQFLSKAYPAIDGYFRDTIRSSLDEEGVFVHEECVVKGSAQAAKLRVDYDDPVMWTNWGLGFTPPAEGHILNYNIIWGASTLEEMPIPANYNFALFRFYVGNGTPVGALPPPDGRHPHILSYNVHGLRSLCVADTAETVGRRMTALFARYGPVVDHLVICEADDTDGGRAAMAAVCKGSGFTHRAGVPNGGKHSVLMVASRHPLAATRHIDTRLADGRTPRGQLLFRTRTGLLGAALHLEIGRRLVLNNEAYNAKARAQNSEMRIAQLQMVLAHGPEFLVGDFNFTLDDPECRFLKGQGFVPTNDGREDSTPYNRVDHFFIREGLAAGVPAGGNTLLHCNLSDHLPMLQALPPARRP